MQTVAVEEIEPTAPGGGDIDRRGLSDPLGTTDVAVNYYALDPGEAFSGGMHAHLDQEEVFYVVSGTATFETKPDATADSETVEVAAGEAIRFAPGEFQQGRNESDEQVFALALGAPKGSTEWRVPRPCSACDDSDVLAVVATDDGVGLECPECGAAFDAEG
jgi:mannose-6-phosphate isomerase-like protein (cupin superfamily)